MISPFAVATSLTPHQIAYLSCDRSRLYTEVIQVLSDRQICWARPLVLTTPDYTVSLNPGSTLVMAAETDSVAMTSSPDLLWPLHQFVPALDTDFLDLMNSVTVAPGDAMGTLLSQFIRRLWETTAGQA